MIVERCVVRNQHRPCWDQRACTLPNLSMREARSVMSRLRLQPLSSLFSAKPAPPPPPPTSVEIDSEAPALRLLVYLPCSWSVRSTPLRT